MKKCAILIFVLAMLVFSGCAGSNTSVDFTNADTQSIQYEQTRELTEDIQTTIIDIPCPENAYISTWCAYHQYIFYSIDYIDFLANQTGEVEKKVKTEEHNTRIVRYDTSDKSIEDIYIADGVIPVSNLNYNGEILIWEEYPGKEEMAWQLKYVDLSKVSEGVKVLLSDGDIEGMLWNVTPKLTEESMYIYEQLDTEKNEHPIILYKYDLKSGEVTQVKDKIDLSSPYEQVSIVGNWMTTYQFAGEKNTIFMENLNTGEKNTIQFSEGVCCPMGSEDFCIWRESYDAAEYPHFLVYSAKEKTLERIELDENIFAYTFLKNYVLMTREDGIWCFDLKTRKYQCLLDDEEYSYVYISTHGDECAYTQIGTLEDGSVRIAKIEVVSE